ncbi:MAG: GID complex subunit containing RING finger motif [Cirrosporium novae-zelandiae]|nr:MAG: GID complex subunit containing RING finger motif [Cirrosporium novae-zelandiae]
MSELASLKLNPDNHILLDQPLLRLPYELLRKNFKSAQRHVQREQEHLLPALKATANASLVGQTPQQTLADLDSMIGRMQGLKRKMSNLHEEECSLHSHSRKRIQHLQHLYEIPSLADVKYDEWSKVRLDRLLVDYMLRNGYEKSAGQLAKEKGIDELVDLEVFVQCHRIAEELKRGKTHECLQWCWENKPALKKGNHTLEFQLRLQQFIELIRTREPSRLADAVLFSRKFLAPHKDQAAEVRKAGGLLAFEPDTQVEPYKSLYSPTRWHHLSTLFVETYQTLLALPPVPLLTIALSAGLSALKTPSCHSPFTSSSSNPHSTTTSVCPICSVELNELARGLPYAHHTKSSVENDPVVLPNGRIYGRERLEMVRRKAGVGKGCVKDPTTGEVFEEDRIRKVFIS